MSNTVEYDGIVGEVNCVYMLADNTHVVLDDACEHGFIVSRVDSISKDEWHVRTIYPSQLKAGTITKAPIKLVDGAAYQFEYHKGAFHGYFKEKTSRLYHSTGWFHISTCTNIIKLVPEVKV